MLIIFDASQNRTVSFAHYRGLHNHIQGLERTRGKGAWIFTRHSWARMVSCYKYMHNRACTAPLEEPLEQTLEKALKAATEEAGKPKPDAVLEIISGNPKQAVFIPVTPEVDVDALLEKWCQVYCKSHRHRLFTVTYPDDVREIGRVL